MWKKGHSIRRYVGFDFANNQHVTILKLVSYIERILMIVNVNSVLAIKVVIFGALTECVPLSPFDYLHSKTITM